jgi:FixJ family two-component response regulator
MTGPEMIAILRHSHPHIPVRFVTGFAGDVEDAAMFAGYEVLRKPYTISTLSTAITNAIGHGQAAPASESHHGQTAAATS